MRSSGRARPGGSAAGRTSTPSGPTRSGTRPGTGGYCAWAVAHGYTASIDPEAWTIFEDRLYLNYSLSVRARWAEDIPGHVRRGDRNWPGVLDR